MGKTIVVDNLKKVFRRPIKKEGFRGLLDFYLRPRYDVVEALKGISFEAFYGEILTILGPNGAGKTTTLKILSGILHPDYGSVSVLGHIPQKREKAFLKSIGFLTSQRRFVEYMGWDLPAVDTFKLVKEIYDIDDRTFKDRVKLLSEMLDLDGILEVPVRKLSLGQRARVEILCAILHYPAVLFLDEPTLGLDIVAQKSLREFIKEFVRKTGTTVLFTSHYMKDIEALSDRLIILNKGRIVFQGRLLDVYEKFSKSKRVEIEFEKMPERVPFKDRLIEMSLMRALYRIDSDKVTSFIKDVVSRFSVKDIKIMEESLEDLIGRIFREAA